MERLFITELQIMNVRHLKDICIPLSKAKMKHLILTGKKWKWQDKCLEYLNRYFMNRERYQVAGVTPFSDDVAALLDRWKRSQRQNQQIDSGMAKRLLNYVSELAKLQDSKDYENGIKAEFSIPEENWIETFSEKWSSFGILWSREKIQA